MTPRVQAYLLQDPEPRTPRVQAYLRGERAQAFTLGDKATLWMPQQVRDLLDGLNATYEQVNRAASGVAEWRPAFAEWQAYYQKQTKRFEGFTIWYGDGDIQEIRRREELVADWQKRLAGKGIDTGPVRTPPKEDGEGLVKAGKWLFGAAVSLVLVPKVLELISGRTR